MEEGIFLLNQDLVRVNEFLPELVSDLSKLEIKKVELAIAIITMGRIRGEQIYFFKTKQVLKTAFRDLVWAGESKCSPL